MNHPTRRLAVSLVLALPLLLPLCGCATAYEWQEVRTAPLTRAEVYDSIDFLAQSDGFVPGSECDRGHGIWVSKWRRFPMGMGRPGRRKLRAEVDLEEGSREAGWTVFFRIELQKVDDLRKSLDPTEDDWEHNGQDREREYLFGERMRRRLGALGAEPAEDPAGDPDRDPGRDP